MLEQLTCNIKIPLALNVKVGFGENQLRTIRRDLLRLRQALVGLLVAALFGEQARQVDQPPDLMRSNLDGASQVSFGAREFLALFGQLRLRPMPFGRIDMRDLLRRGGRLIQAASQEAGRLQVILEEIALSV